ncbi:MAG: peptidoglycan editing factor PgeF [Armatimonadota bacterium]|nr:peptidoglycan editing factor PgeF [Armatimonadota bacterium]MDR5703787.1 peptidoglycan editing factor PgeF [Armatimonadota bacterium]MDR7434937.1 peptidoglycan editing factor PgeF [Armatimonadota bacterium]
MFRWHEADGLPYLSSELLEATGLVIHGFTTRLGGVSKGPFTSLNLGRGVGDAISCVLENRERANRTIGVDPKLQVEAEQVHGTAVALVGRGEGGMLCPGCDGLMTSEEGVSLAIHTADCASVLILDPDHPAVAAVHIGWRGVAAGMAGEVIRGMQASFGSKTQSLLVAIGPAIGACCYEVGPDVLEQMRHWVWIEEVLWPNERGRWQFDLKAAISRQLVDAGVPPGHIATCTLCTACHPDLFFSYRRDGVTGRMAGIIALRGTRWT